MRSVLSAIAVVIGSASTANANEQVPIQVLNKIKAATVYIKVQTPTSGGTGSGFLVKVDDKHFIVTNDHVVNHEEPKQKAGKTNSGQAAQPKIEVVFHSGQPNEHSVETEIVAADAVVDLAVLKLAGNRYLAMQPLDFTKPVRPVETLPIFMLGFPFGGRLAARETNPAITVGRGSISSIRNDEKGQRVIQIDGDVNPGNSGGPVVDSTGRLVGVTVAKILRTNIGMVIPAGEISKLFEPRFPKILFTAGQLANGSISTDVQLEVMDPLSKVKQLQLRYRPAVEGRPITKAADQATWPEMPGSQVIDMNKKDSQAQGRFDVELPSSRRTKLQVQIICSFVDRAECRSEPLLVSLEPGKPFAISVKSRDTAKRPAPVSLVEVPAGRTRADLITGSVKINTVKLNGSYSRAPICWSDDGKALYHVTADGIVRRLSCPSLKEEAAFASELTAGAWLSLSSAGLVVSGSMSPQNPKFDPAQYHNQIIVVDPVTLKPLRTIKEQELVYRVVSAPNSQFSYGLAHLRRGQQALIVYDLIAGQAVRQYKIDELKVPNGHGLRSYVTADGKTLFIRDEEHIYRYSITGDSVTFIASSPPILWKDTYQELAISHDGQWIRTNCKPDAETTQKIRRAGGQASSPSHIFATESLERPALILDTTYYSGHAGFDKTNGWVYVNEHDRIEVFNVKNGDRVAEYMTRDALSRREIQRMIVHPEGRYLAYSMNEPDNKSQRIVVLELQRDAVANDE